MARVNRGHCPQLSFDQLYPVIFAEDACVDHPVVGVHRQAVDSLLHRRSVF